MRSWRVRYNNGQPDETVHAHELAENTRSGVLDQVFLTVNRDRQTSWDRRTIDGSTVSGVFEL